MSLHLLNPNPPLALLRQRQLHPYITARPQPESYPEAIKSTVSSFQDVKRNLDWFFDIAGFQSSNEEEEQDVTERQQLYQWELNDSFPPHLRTIPSDDQVSTLKIFQFNRLYDTAVLAFHAYTFDIHGVHDLGPGGVTSMAALEARNKALHDKWSDHWFFQADNMFTPENVGLRPDWYTDAVFGQQWFTGTNPNTISQASPAWLDVFTQAAKTQSKQAVLNLLSSAGAKAFYILDYTGLRAAAGLGPTDPITSTAPGHPVKFGVQSVALFYLNPQGKIHPLAIIIDWQGSLANSPCILFNKRVLPTDPTSTEAADWPWRYAKTCVQVCDWAHHELVVHLLDTHFVEEMIVVGAHRSFPSDHIVFRLLKEHWTTTLSINALARSTLVPKVIVPLAPVSEDQVYTVLANSYKGFDFTGLYVPKDLENRGFPVAELDTNPKYHNYGYARDIHRMWDTLRKFVASVLTDPTYYGGAGGDAKVAADPYIKAFSAEMQSPDGAKMTTFPTVSTVNQLIDMVTMCIHIAAPQHTAINYLQQYYMTWVPNKPSALYTPPPATMTALQAITEQDLLNALPVRVEFNDDWLLMAQVPYLLSPDVEESVSLPTFARQAAADTDKVIAKAGKTLKSDLDGLTAAFTNIAGQIDDKTKAYEVLYPKSTAKSIVI
jgi:hypothetical protein